MVLEFPVDKIEMLNDVTALMGWHQQTLLCFLSPNLSTTATSLLVLMCTLYLLQTVIDTLVLEFPADN